MRYKLNQVSVVSETPRLKIVDGSIWWFTVSNTDQIRTYDRVLALVSFKFSMTDKRTVYIECLFLKQVG